jgi:hypothetical protein
MNSFTENAYDAYGKCFMVMSNVLRWLYGIKYIGSAVVKCQPHDLKGYRFLPHWTAYYGVFASLEYPSKA